MLATPIPHTVEGGGQLWQGGLCHCHLSLPGPHHLAGQGNQYELTSINNEIIGQGLMLPGALEGIMFYITPQWEQLLNLKVWYAAVTQSFFSLSTGEYYRVVH